MSESTYTDRQYTLKTVKKVVGSVITDTDGWTQATLEDEEGLKLLVPGLVYGLETQGSRITGYFIEGKWYGRKSDQELKEELQSFRREQYEESIQRLKRVGTVLETREKCLPEVFQGWLRQFHEKGGIYFRRVGWEYELVVAELASLIHGGASEEEVDKYCRLQHATSHQLGCAKGLLLILETNKNLSGVYSAISSITGDRFYTLERK